MNFQDAVKSLGMDNRRCAVGKWLTSLTDTDQHDIATALESPLPKYRVYRACQRMGLTVAYETFNRHTSGTCRCYR